MPAAALAVEEDGGKGLKRLAELAGGAVIAPSKASKGGKCRAALACRLAIWCEGRAKCFAGSCLDSCEAGWLLAMSASQAA